LLGLTQQQVDFFGELHDVLTTIAVVAVGMEAPSSLNEAAPDLAGRGIAFDPESVRGCHIRQSSQLAAQLDRGRGGLDRERIGLSFRAMFVATF